MPSMSIHNLFAMKSPVHRLYHCSANLSAVLCPDIKLAFMNYMQGYVNKPAHVNKSIYDNMDCHYDKFMFTIMTNYFVHILIETKPIYMGGDIDEVMHIAGWMLSYGSSKGSLIINHIEVLEPYRGNNYGALLYKHALNKTRTSGYENCKFQFIRNKPELINYGKYLQSINISE